MQPISHIGLKNTPPVTRRSVNVAAKSEPQAETPPSADLVNLSGSKASPVSSEVLADIPYMQIEPGPGIFGQIGNWLSKTSFGQRRLGLIPADTPEPKVSGLDFSWNKISDSEFSSKMEVAEQQLRDPEATIVARRRLQGSNHVELVTLSNGATAVWKPERFRSKTIFRENIPSGQIGQREEAAYLVDKGLGHLARVPPSIYRDMDGLKGSLTLFVPGTRSMTTIDSDERADEMSPEDYRRVAIYDHTIGNVDRHGQNWLLCDEGRPIPIDHNLCMPKKNGFQGWNHFNFVRKQTLNESEKARLQGLKGASPKLYDRLEELVGKKAVNAMVERVDTMLSKGTTDHGWRWGDGPRTTSSRAYDQYIDENEKFGEWNLT